MATIAYYDNILPSSAVEQQLSKLRAQKDNQRSTAKAYVYKFGHGSEAMVENAGPGKLRLRLFAGRCPCGA